MNKIVSGFLALCLVAALGAGVQAKDNDKMHGSMHGGMGMGHKHKCPPGQHWVNGYNKKNGTHVKGYCR